jgi:hypothetical protein
MRSSRDFLLTMVTSSGRPIGLLQTTSITAGTGSQARRISSAPTGTLILDSSPQETPEWADAYNVPVDAHKAVATLPLKADAARHQPSSPFESIPS